jgi:ABC-type sulfate transport system permease component
MDKIQLIWLIIYCIYLILPAAILTILIIKIINKKYSIKDSLYNKLVIYMSIAYTYVMIVVAAIFITMTYIQRSN